MEIGYCGAERLGGGQGYVMRGMGEEEGEGKGGKDTVSMEECDSAKCPFKALGFMVNRK
jgi:hypothetical protein